MLLAMFVAGTTDLYSQSMNKRTEETPQSVIANVHKAARLLKEKGSEALAVLTDPKSEFNDRDAYLFIIDVDKSLVVSNPRFPERTGGNIREHLGRENTTVWNCARSPCVAAAGSSSYGRNRERKRACARCPISTRFRVCVTRYVQAFITIPCRSTS